MEKHLCTLRMNMISCLGAFSTLRSNCAISFGIRTGCSLAWLSWRSIRVWRISWTMRLMPASCTSDIRRSGSRNAEGNALTISTVLYLVATFSNVFISIVWSSTSRDSLTKGKGQGHRFRVHVLLFDEACFEIPTSQKYMLLNKCFEIDFLVDKFVNKK